jgi:hypothetical protein
VRKIGNWKTRTNVSWEISTNVRFEVFTAVTMKNGVFWVLTRATRRNNPEDTILQSLQSSYILCSILSLGDLLSSNLYL